MPYLMLRADNRRLESAADAALSIYHSITRVSTKRRWIRMDIFDFFH